MHEGGDGSEHSDNPQPIRKGTRGRFFQVDRHVWNRVAAEGLNASVSYLVMACGTGGDNRTTAWSTNAIEKYTGIGRSSAKAAIAALIRLGAVSQTKDGTKPSYRLEPLSLEQAEPHWIWLPNTLVTGAAGERPPVERVRALQDVRTLQQLIGLYDVHDLAENGGLHWRHIRVSYERTRITERGIWHIWGFTQKTDAAWHGTRAFAPFESGGRTKKKADSEEFWASWGHLKRLGLVECVPHLVEADNDEAMVICPCPAESDAGTPEEKALGDAARLAAFALLEDSAMSHNLDCYDVTLPVPDNFPAVELVGIYRLRYRPHTAKTAAWIAKANVYDDWRERFETLATGEATATIAA